MYQWLMMTHSLSPPHLGQFVVDMKDDAVRSMTVVLAGEKLPPFVPPPPPPTQAVAAKAEDQKAPLDPAKEAYNSALVATGGTAAAIAAGSMVRRCIQRHWHLVRTVASAAERGGVVVVVVVGVVDMYAVGHGWLAGMCVLAGS